MRRCFPALALVLLAAGCPPKTPAGGVFPSLAELEGLAGQTPPAADTVRVVDVDAWELEGDLPHEASLVPRKTGDRWDGFLAAAVAEQAGRIQLSEAMRCVAQETGRFQLLHRATPPEDLRDFMLARCGSTAADFQVAFQAVDHTESYPDKFVLEALDPATKETLTQVLAGLDPKAAWTAGIWRGRTEERSLVAIAFGQRLAKVDAVSLTPDDEGRIQVRGEAWVPAEQVNAHVNRGRFGGGECERDESVEPPRFAFVCRVDPADEKAWVEIGAAPPGRLLGRRIFTALTWPSGVPTSTYTRPGFSQELPGGESTTRTFLNGLNAVRREGELQPIREIPAQSVLAARLAPHYFAEVLSGAPSTRADRILLGLAAGWKVRGLLRYGRVTAAWTGHSKDPHRLLASALERPVSRSVLLDPAAEAIAIGPIERPDQEFLGVLVGTYALYQNESQSDRVQAVIDRLNDQRAKAGHPPVTKIVGLKQHAAHAVALLETDGESPDRALQAFLQRSAETVRRQVSGWTVETRSLEEFTAPDPLVNEPVLHVEIGVAYYLPPNEPWGRYVVMIVTAAPVKA